MLDLLRNQLDITQVPFSDRGSRLLVFKEQDQDRLYIKLAERLMGLDSALEAHVHRPPFIQNLGLLGPDGQSLSFSLVTAPDFLVFETEIGTFKLAFQDETALAFGLPAGFTCGIMFTVNSEHYQVADSVGKNVPVRTLTWSTTGEFVKNEITPIAGGETVEVLVRSGEDCSLQIRISDSRSKLDGPVPFSDILVVSRAVWQEWFEKAPPVAEEYRQTYAYAWWVLANNLVNPRGNVKFEAAMPTKAKYIGLWLWDSALHAVALRHIDPQLARDQIRVFLEHQQPDGMLPDVVFDEGVVTEIGHPIKAKVTKPPILAWAALKVHETAPDIDFLIQIYRPLERWNAWWFEQSDEGIDGLAQYNHPYSSGLDDNPLWDEGMPVVSPDLNTYLYHQMQALGRIAGMLGLEAEAARWQERSESLVRLMIERLWDEESGVFRALHRGKPVPVLTPFNLYPLWTGALPLGIGKRLLEHLKSPREFWGKRMLPTVARNDPNYSPETMWRGPVWANINYFFVEALEINGLHDDARTLREATLDLLRQTNGIYEYYNPETGEPPVTAAPMFGWSAAVFIDLAIRRFF